MAKNKGKKEQIDIEDIEIEDEVSAKRSKKSKEAEAAPKGKGTKAPEKGKQPEHLKREALPEGYVTAEQLAEEFGKKGRDVRQVLRDNEFDKPENGRWAWHEKKDASTLKRLRALLSGGGTKKAKDEPKEEVKGKGKSKEQPAPEQTKKKKSK